MRIDRLDLRAYGPFTGTSLDLTQGAEGLHVVYGRNEAGKSSALRAISDLLFGIHARTKDDFLHSYSELRIGATLRAQDGRTIAFVRRKANKNPLWNDADDTALGDDALAPFVRRLDKEEFERVFGIDHERLRAGSEALLDPGGGTTAAIVGSGLGILDLRGVQRALEGEADAMFSPRARSKPINELQKRLKDLAKETADLSVTGTAWNKLRETLASVEREFAAATARGDEIEQQRMRLLQLRRVREPVAARRAARMRLPAGLPVPSLDDDFACRRRAAETSLATAKSAHASAGQRLEKLRDQLAAFPTSFVLLEHDETIELLRDAAATVSKALRDLPHRQVELAAELEERNGIGAALQIELDEEGIRTLRARAAAGPDTTRLENAVGAAQRLGDIHAQRQTFASRCADIRARIDDQLARFRTMAGRVDDLDTIALRPVPGSAVIDNFVARFARIDEAERDGRKTLDRLRGELATLESDREALLRDGAVPAESDLAAERDRRARLWQLVRRAWLKGEEIDGEFRALDRDRALPESFEAAVDAADAIADVLRSESDRVAEVAGLARGIARHRKLVESATQQQAATAEERRAIEVEWAVIWSATGLEPRPPGPMRDILFARDGLLALRDELRTVDSEQTGFEGRVQDANRRLLRAMNGPPDGAEDLSLTLERAELDLLRERRAQAAWSALLGHHVAAEKLRARIAAMQADASTFADDVAQLLSRCATDLIGADPHEAIRALTKRSREQREQQARREALAAQIEAAEEEHRELDLAQHNAGDQLRALCREAGVDDPNGLPALEECARAERILRSEGAESLDELEALVDHHAGVDIDAAIAPLDRALQEARDAAEVCRAARLEAKQQFAAIDGTSRAAAKAQEAQEVRARLRTEVTRYLRATLAARLLSVGLERYRQQNETPVLALASRHLAGLTRGRHTGVHGDVDDKGTPFLLVEGKAGTRTVHRQVTELSDGTRDQLHLALVLGSLEHRFAHEEPRPLILDDILVHFDDTRSAAALEVLADFSAKTQVLLFTHHHRIREQAQALGAERSVYVHEL